MKHYQKQVSTWGKTCSLFCLLFLLSVIPIVAQNIAVKGQVYDEGTNLPVVGATVVQQGTNNATTTDMDGNFSINVPSNATLDIILLGYSRQSVSVNGQTSLKIAMQEDVKMLNEFVAIGYGTIKKKDLTGAVSSYKLEGSLREDLPNPNVMDALKGTIPGLNISVGNSAGGDPKISIRGINSIKASNNPLIVLDGIPFPGSLNEINPNDIASVDVLKDASAAAVFGARAANGVILISTKRGKTDKPIVRLRATAGFQTYTRRPEMYSPERYLQFKKDVRQLNGATGTDLDYKNLLTPYEYKAWEEGHTVDWFDEVTRVAFFQDYNMSVAGATDRTNYYISGNFNSQPGIVVGDEYSKITLLAKVESQVTKWLKVGLSLNALTRNFDGVPADLRTGTILGPYGYKNSPLEGYGQWLERYPNGHTTSSSPFWNTQIDDYDRNQNYYGLAFGRIDLPWVQGLSYTYTLGMNRWEQHRAQFRHEQMFMDTMKESDLLNQTKYLVDAYGYRSNTERFNWTMNHLINYNKTLGIHSFDVTLLAERQKTERRETRFDGKDFSQIGSSVLGYNGLKNGNSSKRDGTTTFTRQADLAYMARVNYTLMDRYNVSASIRRDGSSALGEGSKYDTFKAGGLAWTLSEEEFMKPIKNQLNYFKIRASYGENGNPTVGAYSTFAKMGSGYYIFGNSTASTIYPSNFANKGIRWERTAASNIGFDFGIFNDVLSGSFNYYNSNTTDLILDRAMPIMNGQVTVVDNIGKINNKGVEIQLNSKNITTKDFAWGSTLNFWLNRNKIKSLYGLDGNKDGIEDDDIANNYFINKPRNPIYTYVVDGIIQKEDTEYMAKYGGNPGDVKFKDLNDDGKITAEFDRKIVGHTLPNFTVNFANTFTYKNLSLYVMLNWIAGGGKDNYYIGRNDYAFYPNAFAAGLNNWLNKEYWMPDKQSNEIPRPNWSNSMGTQFVQKRDFLRIQDISLSYNLDKKTMKSLPFENIRIFTSAKNLFLFTGWEGLDPEYENGIQYAQDGGGGYPVLKTITFGLDISF